MYTKQWEDAKLKYPDNIYSLRYEWLIKVNIDIKGSG
jgi:hypothetical protein